MQAIMQKASKMLATFIEWLETKVGTDYSYSHRAGAKLTFWAPHWNALVKLLSAKMVRSS